MLKKYKWKCRLLVINTPNYKNSEYKKTKIMYQKDIKKFHKRNIKLITIISKNQFYIDFIGFDGQKKLTTKTLDVKKLFEIVDRMPMINKNLKPINLSLFSDYNPKTTTPGLGYKDKNKALYTIKVIKKRNLKYQVNVISTMLGRAKKHPAKTKGMIDSIKIFKKWMKNYKKTNSKLNK